MKKTLIFGTTNKGKLAEAQHILTEFKIIGKEVESEEIQSLDNKKVALQKAKDYYQALKKPLFIEDVSLEIEALNNLPGVYINDFMKALGNKGIIKLLKNSKNRKAKAITTIAYTTDGENYEIFEGIIKGEISKSVKGDNGFGWDPIFVPKGSKKTFAQMDIDEKNNYSMRAKALGSLAQLVRAHDSHS